MADTDELTDDTQDRIAAFKRQADIIQAQRNVAAQSDQPPGSPSQFLGRGSQPLGPVSYFQANGQTGPMLVPRGAEGIRGYPSADEIAASNASTASQYKEDQFNSDLNSVSGRYPSAGHIPIPTDQLIDVGMIQSRQNAIHAQMNDRISHVQTDSDQPIALGRGRFAPSKASQTRAELGILERAASGLDRSQAEAIQQNSRVALQNAKDNEVFGQDVARAQVVDFLNGIDDTRYPHGSDDRQKFIGKVFGSRPDWLHVMAKDPHLSKYVQDHVEAQYKVAQTMAQLKTLYPDQESLPQVGGVTYAPTVGQSGKTGWNRLPSQGSRPIPEKTADRYAKLIGDIAYHEQNQPVEEAANVEKQKAANMQANKPNTAYSPVPYSQASKLAGAIAEKQQLESRYPGLGAANKKAVQIPRAAMDALRNDPSRAEEFDKKYGTGNAEIILR